MTDVAAAAAPEHVVEALELPDVPGVWSRLGFGFWMSVGWLAFVSVIAVLAPVLPMPAPSDTRLAPPFDGPQADHWFGVDAVGADVLSQTIWGARTSLLVGFIAVLVGFVVGGSLGIMAGYFRGPFDRVVTFFFTVLLSFPALLLAILITDLTDRSLIWISLILGILAIAPVGRLARAQTLVFSEREFVQAARILGAKDSRILLREIVPNVVIPMSALALLGMGIAIVAEGTLAFLSVSVEGGESWGKQIFASGSEKQFLIDGPHAALIPITIVTLTVLALNFAGDRLREVLDAKELSL